MWHSLRMLLRSWSSEEKRMQKILNTVIDTGFYVDCFPSKVEANRQSLIYTPQHMCDALWAARMHDVISSKDLLWAKERIREYLFIKYGNYSQKVYYLQEYLDFKSLPSDFAARLELYKHWSLRP